MHDVYAYGVIAASTLIELSDGYPPPAGYAEIAAVYPSIGGEAGAGAVVLARLGIATKLAGSQLGTDEASHRVIDILDTAGVETSAISRLGPLAAATEVIISAGDSRTILGTYGRHLETESWDAPSQEDVHASRIVCLDPFFGAQSLQVARWCQEGEIPYVTVDAPPDSEIATQAGVLIVSEEYVDRVIGGDLEEAFATYARRCDGLVILTQGGRELLYGRGTGAPRTRAPFSVVVRDTTGAGDSFRAGIIYGMLRGFDTDEIVETASAVAALVCQTAPGVLHSPTPNEVVEFLSAQG